MPRPARAPAAFSLLAAGAALVHLGLACKKDPVADGSPDPQDPALCARPADQVTAAGDANGDGEVDIADPVLILRHAAAGGQAPACPEAVDLVPDGRVQLDDAFTLLVALAEGLFDPDSADADDCADGAALPAPTDCQDLAITLEAPAQVEANESFSATFSFASTGLAVEGWSLPVTAEGCTITAATTDGTAAAAVTHTPAGLRDLGYDLTTVADGAATSVVVLGFMDRVTLPADGQARGVLALQVQAGDCGICTLTIGRPATGLGPEIPAVVAANDASWPLPQSATDITVCP